MTGGCTRYPASDGRRGTKVSTGGDGATLLKDRAIQSHADEGPTFLKPSYSSLHKSRYPVQVITVKQADNRDPHFNEENSGSDLRRCRGYLERQM